MLINLVRLVEDSVSVQEGTHVYFSETDTTAELTDINETIKRFEGRRVYCVENGVLGFIVNGYFYVTPLTEKKLAFLVEKENFEREDFFIPFSDGSVPKSFENVWRELLFDAENPG